LPASLLAKIEQQRKKIGLNSTSAVIRQALAAFDFSRYQSASEERRQISVRLAFEEKALLVKTAKKQGVSLGEILRAAVENLPDETLPDKTAPATKEAATKVAPAKKSGGKATAAVKAPVTVPVTKSRR
jgi:Arc/MetJ-type ribon-helix-helix transcriptional regulator